MQQHTFNLLYQLVCWILPLNRIFVRFEYQQEGESISEWSKDTYPIYCRYIMIYTYMFYMKVMQSSNQVSCFPPLDILYNFNSFVPSPSPKPKACARQGLWQQALAVFATAQAGMEDGVMLAVTISACEKGGD